MSLQQLDVGPYRFPANVEGPADGPVVLLLHGWPQTPAAWDALVPALAASGHRVVAPWQRGYTAGARPRLVTDYRLDRLVEDVLGMADAVGADRFDVVGHDWGGAVAWALAAQHPGRLRTITSLSTPHPAAMLASLPRSAQVLRSAYIPFFQLPWVPERLLLAAGGAPLRTMLERSGLDGGRAAAYVEAMAEPGALTAALSWYRAAGASPAQLRAVGRIAVPTLFVWGSADPALGRTAAEGTAAHVDGAYRFVPLEGAGHWLPERHAADVLPPLLAHLGG
jgi:pimeloyl-ACP methyl ester carboxylesterase